MSMFHPDAVMARLFVVGMLVGAVMLTLPAGLQASGVVHVPGLVGSHEVGVTSLQAMRFKTVIRQRYDFSCGSAALATLLTYHYGRPVSEQDTFNAMFEMGDQERIRMQGFSMLDMKRYLQTRQGLGSDGFRLPLEKLDELGVPAIALVDIDGYRHFVVIKGIRDGRVLLGDPALGVRDYSVAGFKDIWSNDILFLIRDEVSRGREHFNAPVAWDALTKPPYGTALARDGLSNFILSLPRASDW
ncbi:C39 family peptidase [Ectothiorhodospira lacustris]|uniref:C39 family peptidase n=1 Tax=Ectothiorhodospira lacustris TaxID=2899127 RepID=UPI001EE7A4BC|nr:C39 family peptidase [Ectothiorhodospira lacustris]MCG5502243.1 C39 family peptidase [Ectothiorhodospira lacustris]MCG5509881.1 C39 family peptidase [Ectothiorhodospira lacustris]MCG5521134.1 C39 family peptidase [Ectothiorhodospira lacustris]